MLDLVQDSDCDVRAAAAGGLGRVAESDGGRGKLGGVTKVALVEGYRLMGELVGGKVLRRRVCEKMAVECRSLGDDIDSLYSSLAFGGGDGGDRDIFEKETPNDYEERCLNVQLGYRVVVGLGDGGGGGEFFGDILKRVIKVVGRGEENLMRSVLQNPRIFLGLHALMTGCVAHTKSGGGLGVGVDSEGLVLLAKRSSSISIQAASEFIARKNENENDNQVDEERLCFLL